METKTNEMNEQELVQIILDMKEAGNNLKKRLVSLDRRLLEMTGRDIEEEPLLNEVVVWKRAINVLSEPKFVDKI